MAVRPSLPTCSWNFPSPPPVRPDPGIGFQIGPLSTSSKESVQEKERVRESMHERARENTRVSSRFGNGACRAPPYPLPQSTPRYYHSWQPLPPGLYTLTRSISFMAWSSPFTTEPIWEVTPFIEIAVCIRDATASIRAAMRK